MIAVLTVERATNCGSFRPLTPLDFHKRFKTWIEAFVERFERLIVQVAAGCTFFLIILETSHKFPKNGDKERFERGVEEEGKVFVYRVKRAKF